MYEVNSIIGVGNLLLNSITIGAVLGIWRVKVKMAKAQALVNAVGPVPPLPMEIPPPPPQPVQQPIPTVQPQTIPKTPAEVKGGEPARKSNHKAQKQINLLTAELERLKAL